MEQQISLYFKDSSSDKEYHAQLEKKGNGYVVNYQHGKRGGTLQTGTKTNEPVPLDKATKIYNQLVKSKTSKGYSEGVSGVKFQDHSEKTYSGISPQLLNELTTEEELNKFINDDNFYAQEKFDGERRLVRKTKNTTEGINKKGVLTSLTQDIVDSINEECTIDSEQIGNHLYVFDLRNYKGKNLENKTYEQRLNELEKLSFGNHITVVYTARTKKEKQYLLNKIKKNNQEGIVFKHKDHHFKEGRDKDGVVFKYKLYKTTTVRVSSLSDGKRSVHMEMLKNNKPIAVGKVTIPPNKDVPTVGSFIEVRYLYAYREGALYQPTYLGDRSQEQDESNINVKQLIYKPED